MRERLAARLIITELEYREAQRLHDGSQLACLRYRAALRELGEAEEEASRFLRRMVERPCSSEESVTASPA